MLNVDYNRVASITIFKVPSHFRVAVAQTLHVTQPSSCLHSQLVTRCSLVSPQHPQEAPVSLLPHTHSEGLSPQPQFSLYYQGPAHRNPLTLLPGCFSIIHPFVMFLLPTEILGGVPLT